jgi:hypothetical protein
MGYVVQPPHERGWVIATYDNQTDAELIAGILNRFQETEVK